MKNDKFNVIDLITVKKMSDEKVYRDVNIGKQKYYVYDIQTETHDFNCEFPLKVHNTDIFVLSVNTKDNIKDLKNLEGLIEFSNLKENHELLSNKNKKVTGKYKMETPKFIWIDGVFCLRSKLYAFKCGDSSKIKPKSISKSYSKNLIFDEYKKTFRW